MDRLDPLGLPVYLGPDLDPGYLDRLDLQVYLDHLDLLGQLGPDYLDPLDLLDQ